MTSNVMPSIVRIEANELKALVKEVKETVASNVIRNPKTQSRIFGAVDMWNLRRKMKTASLAAHYGL
ncbi:hypothetical protein [Sediminibacterium soli]|uniref:hypothetical protein n=1 Tax=Sediminibacterium soli TaxID=2698829 RepID=UPI00137ABC6C|nr:hypothetical protein [Sediminibacterium soli]NCI46130.1 hypothetical protein [Sediminibacterium soli]